MEPLSHEDYWNVQIDWSLPQEYERLLELGSPNDDLAHLYLISARYGKNEPKTIYIGQTYNQWVSKRLTQADHQSRYADFVENYSRHRLYVSHGIVTVHDGKITRKRINDIERILIYTNDPTHAHNIKNFQGHGVSTPYQIENRGSRCTLPRQISLGVFVRY